MNVLETDWWLLSLPENWQAEQEEETVIVTDPDGVGELVITTLLPGAEDAIDLHDLMREAEVDPATGERCTLGDFSGLVVEPAIDEGEYLREWYVARDDLLLVISYLCDADNAVMDRDMIDEILATLGVKRRG